MLSDDEEQTDYSTDEEEEADTPFFNVGTQLMSALVCFVHTMFVCREFFYF